MNKPIYIHLDKTDRYMDKWQSHFFGMPAMPPEYPMPVISNTSGVPMPMICQINLSDLPENGMLPREGYLLVFADFHYYDNSYVGEPNISMHVSEPQDVHVVYIPKEDIGRMVWRTDASDANLEPISVTFNHERPSLEEPEMQLFGRTDHLEWEDWPEQCEGWTLLLQVDSMEWDKGRYVLNFVDWGVLCFLIAPEALRHLDFSNVRAIILST